MNRLKHISDILIKRGYELLNKPYEFIKFTGNDKADKIVNNINNYSHFFTLGCIMDSQIKAERAWEIPYKISEVIRSINFKDFVNLTENNLTKIFTKNSLHRFNDRMSKNFYLGIQKIHNDYNDRARNIWNNKPSSATVVRRFLEFQGVGIKISTMAANILARDFKVPMNDYCSIDISPDIQVIKVFKRIGFINKNDSNDILVYKARELNSEYPGIFDLSCWEIGRKWCKNKEPVCSECYLAKYCYKILV